jgi:hypothetical protein
MINLAWEKLDEYYSKLDEAPAYAAALILHPRYRLKYFKQKWVGSLRRYYEPIKKSYKAIYTKEYKPQPVHLTKEEEQRKAV